MKRLTFLTLLALLLMAFQQASGQELKLNDLEYFETQGVNVLVYSNFFTGGFNDEKTAGTELIDEGINPLIQGMIINSVTRRYKNDIHPSHSKSLYLLYE